MAADANVTSPRESHGPRVRESPSPTSGICRCGTRVPAGVTGAEVQGLPPSVQELFTQRTFCSVKCVRAFCLESLEALDALDTPSSHSVVTDLHFVYQDLAVAFSKIILET